MNTVGGGGAVGEFGEGLLGLQGTAGNSHLVQISGTGYDGGGRQLARGVRQPGKVSEEVSCR